MRSSEFEEKEYEAPLYVQLQHANTNVWSPGQVLEARVGFDYALFTSHPYFWKLQGFAVPPSGVVLGAHPSEHWWHERHFRRPLPDFSLNLFIQAKRPIVGLRAPKVLKAVGLTSPYWKFLISQNQQLVLESLATSTAGTALVCYASAAFDRVTELYAHSRTKSIVQTSTFPTGALLRDHEAWHYTAAGCSGIANPTPERIEDVPLLERIRQFTTQRSVGDLDGTSFSANLKRLATAVYESLSANVVGDSGRTAVYFEALREIDQYVDFASPHRYTDALRSYLAVAVFASLFGLQWHTLALSDA
jgi:hypothetical protein